MNTTIKMIIIYNENIINTYSRATINLIDKFHQSKEKNIFEIVNTYFLKKMFALFKSSIKKMKTLK